MENDESFVKEISGNEPYGEIDRNKNAMASDKKVIAENIKGSGYREVDRIL